MNSSSKIASVSLTNRPCHIIDWTEGLWSLLLGWCMSRVKVVQDRGTALTMRMIPFPRSSFTVNGLRAVRPDRTILCSSRFGHRRLFCTTYMVSNQRKPGNENIGCDVNPLIEFSFAVSAGVILRNLPGQPGEGMAYFKTTARNGFRGFRLLTLRWYGFLIGRLLYTKQLIKPLLHPFLDPF